MTMTFRKRSFWQNRITHKLVQILKYTKKTDTVVVAGYGGGVFPMKGEGFAKMYTKVSRQEALEIASNQ